MNIRRVPRLHMERLDRSQVVAFLNEFLTIMVDVLVDHSPTSGS
jgi:hypothetical protein